MIRAKITGTGSCLPEKVLTNFDLERMLDTSDEWIVARTGIHERRIAGEGEYTSTFASQAALRALEAAGVAATDIDLIVMGEVLEHVDNAPQFLRRAADEAAHF